MIPNAAVSMCVGKLYVVADRSTIRRDGFHNYITFLDRAKNKWVFSDRRDFPEIIVILCVSKLLTITKPITEYEFRGDVAPGKTIGDYSGYEVLIGGRKLFIPQDQLFKLQEIKKPTSS